MFSSPSVSLAQGLIIVMFPCNTRCNKNWSGFRPKVAWGLSSRKQYSGTVCLFWLIVTLVVWCKTWFSPHCINFWATCKIKEHPTNSKALGMLSKHFTGKLCPSQGKYFSTHYLMHKYFHSNSCYYLTEHCRHFIGNDGEFQSTGNFYSKSANSW